MLQLTVRLPRSEKLKGERKCLLFHLNQSIKHCQSIPSFLLWILIYTIMCVINHSHGGILELIEKVNIYRQGCMIMVKLTIMIIVLKIIIMNIVILEIQKIIALLH